MRKIINIHSTVDLITNSSTEIFTFDSEHSEGTIRSMLYDLCKDNNDFDWYDKELRVTDLGNGRIEIYSWLNEPDWIYDFIKQFENLTHE